MRDRRVRELARRLRGPLLGPLQSNGGLTETHALTAGSPAIAVVTGPIICRTADQRGVARSTPCDAGACEAP